MGWNIEEKRWKTKLIGEAHCVCPLLHDQVQIKGKSQTDLFCAWYIIT